MVVSRLEAIWFNINQQCNLECAHCLTNSGPSSKAVGRFYLTGGEPTLHPEFFEMIEALQALGEVIFFTNATLFDEEKIERLEAVAEKERLEVRLSWTEYHFDSYQEMLPADPGMRYPIDVWKELKARGFRMTLVSMDGSGDKNLGLFPTLRGRQVCEVVPPVWMDGRVFTCPPLTNVAPFKLGNIHTDSLQELLERRPDTIKSPQCAVCRQHEP
jgi:MoaA/NifB/PqqE/SkfB family radical SAM enzyme